MTGMNLKQGGEVRFMFLGILQNNVTMDDDVCVTVTGSIIQNVFANETMQLKVWLVMTLS
jgi:hypothetical protein